MEGSPRGCRWPCLHGGQQDHRHIPRPATQTWAEPSSWASASRAESQPLPTCCLGSGPGHPFPWAGRLGGWKRAQLHPPRTAGLLNPDNSGGKCPVSSARPHTQCSGDPCSRQRPPRQQSGTCADSRTHMCTHKHTHTDPCPTVTSVHQPSHTQTVQIQTRASPSHEAAKFRESCVQNRFVPPFLFPLCLILSLQRCVPLVVGEEGLR